jgi:endo-1,4-beta-xylanase
VTPLRSLTAVALTTAALTTTALSTSALTAGAIATSAPPTSVPAVRPAVAAPATARDAAGPHSLRALASRVNLRIGTAVNTDELADNARYRQITANQFSTVTPENAMKWASVEPTRGHYDWSAADRLVRFADRHHQRVRGHTLVWHNQNPAWVSDGGATPAELRRLLKQHVTAEASHFRGRIWQWDVVNEAFNDDGTLRDTPWLRAFGGPRYIAQAFRWAHRADPHALLFYNDYNIEGMGPKSDAVLALVRRLVARGVPIDGVGVQTHLDTQYDFPDRMRDNLHRFTRLGLDVALTEVDVRSPLPVDSTEQLAQNAGYAQSLQACLALRRCLSYTVWGFADAYSWVPGTFPGEGAADLYDAALRPKPSYYAVRDVLSLAAGAPRRPVT